MKKPKRKRNKYIQAIIGSSVFLVIGAIAFALGFQMAGFDVLAWLVSEQAFFVYALLIVVILFLIFFGYKAKMNDIDSK